MLLVIDYVVFTGSCMFLISAMCRGKSTASLCSKPLPWPGLDLDEDPESVRRAEAWGRRWLFGGRTAEASVAETGPRKTPERTAVLCLSGSSEPSSAQPQPRIPRTLSCCLISFGGWPAWTLSRAHVVLCRAGCELGSGSCQTGWC